MTVSPSPLPQIQVENVSLAPNLFRSVKLKLGEFAGANLLQDLSFQVFPGDRVAIVGASGAGKTSLLRLLNRLSEPTTGTLYFNGQPYPQITTMQLRQQIVLVPQESKLLGMTVEEALAYPLELRGIPKKMIQQRIGEWSDRFHLSLEWMSKTEQQLSVGQRQLVAIVRALVIQPPILLLDEPTSALDVGRSHQVLDILTELSSRQQTTVVMANHQLTLAQQFATRVLHLQNGQVLADEPAHAVDWAAVEQHLRATEAEQADEWK
ncbi:MAG: ATP-binding cassette domain-containing protein [Oscillatoriales cyanobacterium C42_A2020_001]|nr:ATP-binding cassette domain-containing protein [Leptolyngbyaceae cyanobacterium C42_A2020_001]